MYTYTSNKQLNTYLTEMKSLEDTYLGFPNNMSYDYSDITSSSGVYLNNAGDPFGPLSWKKHSKVFEREVLHFFMKLYGLAKHKGWGYITTGGTEGNMQGMLIARDTMVDGVCFFSQDTHYSIKKIMRLLKIKYHEVPSLENGEIDCVELDKLIKKYNPPSVIMVINCGTTVKGAFDPFEKIKQILKANAINRSYFHVDAALSGMIVPFVKGAPYYSFNRGIDSIAISAHKFLGTPLISGVVIVKKDRLSAVREKVEYINSYDTTILGSRNGHAPLYIWYAIKKYGKKRFSKDANTCIELSKYLCSELTGLGFNPHLNEYSNTVYFNKPSDRIIDAWQLSCSGDIAHIIVMQHVTKNMIDRFVASIRLEREAQAQPDLRSVQLSRLGQVRSFFAHLYAR